MGCSNWEGWLVGGGCNYYMPIMLTSEKSWSTLLTLLLSSSSSSAAASLLVVHLLALLGWNFCCLLCCGNCAQPGPGGGGGGGTHTGTGTSTSACTGTCNSMQEAVSKGLKGRSVGLLSALLSAGRWLLVAGRRVGRCDLMCRSLTKVAHLQVWSSPESIN